MSTVEALIEERRAAPEPLVRETRHFLQEAKRVALAVESGAAEFRAFDRRRADRARRAGLAISTV